jgi:hypothetical protein
MAEIHDFIFAAIDAHRRVNIARSGFLNRTGACEQFDSDEDADLDQQYCEAAMAAARRQRRSTNRGARGEHSPRRKEGRHQGTETTGEQAEVAISETRPFPDRARQGRCCRCRRACRQERSELPRVYLCLQDLSALAQFFRPGKGRRGFPSPVDGVQGQAPEPNAGRQGEGGAQLMPA